jgi:hypothetical protein
MAQIQINYVPNKGVDGRPNQYDFHQARYTYKFRIVICGERAGKTLSNVAEAITWSMTYPRCVGWLGEPDYPRVKKILEPAFSKILGKQNIDHSPLINGYNRSDHCITWQNGSTTWLGSMEDPEASEGPTWDYAGLDEARRVRKILDCWEVMKSRLSGTGALPAGVKPALWITTTPSPVRSDLWNLFALESKERIEGSKIFSWKQGDNAKLDKDYITMQDKTIKDPSRRMAVIEGQWPTTGTGVLPFDYNRHVIDDWDRIPDENYIRKIIYGVDWGYAPDPFVIVAILVDNNGRCYIVDEFYEIEFDPDKRWEAAQEMQEKWGKGIFWCGKDRPEFIRKFRDHRLDARGDQSQKRESGIDDLIARCYDWDGSPRIFWWHECKNAIFEASQYDPTEDGEDDCTDATRYAIANTFKSGKLSSASVDLNRPGQTKLAARRVR